MLLLLLSAEAVAVPPAIIVTASRVATDQQNAAANTTLIDAERADALGEPLSVALLRQSPSTAVSIGGPAGSISEVRIRGAEANHSLLFIDGIRANDPAAGNAPRFELLGADLADRIEIVRGPQSALWGSEAIGGVVALSSDTSRPALVSVEGGSLGSARLSARAGASAGTIQARVAGGYQRSSGIDSFGASGGDRDGYSNLALRGRLAWQPSSTVQLALTGFAVRGRSDYDGYANFVLADTDDVTRNRLGALGLTGRWEGGDWTVSASASRLRSRNRNLLGETFLNQTTGGRESAGIQVERALATGKVSHQFVVAADYDRERFGSTDAVYFGATDQRRTRTHAAFTGEWRARLGPLLTDLAVRRDLFSAFQDSTTLRASAVLTLSNRWSLIGGYAEGIAQPTFFDLYGFFPESFVGNPDLQPEQSSGWEAGARYSAGPFRISAALFQQRLRGEIVEQFLPEFRSTAVNAAGVSRRAGVELEAGWQLDPGVRLTGTYAYLKATERRAPGDEPIRELRRPRHSGGAVIDGTAGRWTYGASASFVGDRGDTNFDVFPAQKVKLQSYWLIGGRLAYGLSERVQLFGRIANALDAEYQEAFGYRTEGRTVYAGIRLGLDR